MSASLKGPGTKILQEKFREGKYNMIISVEIPTNSFYHFQKHYFHNHFYIH